jgi:flagellar biosynthesis GTPase FlhF
LKQSKLSFTRDTRTEAEKEANRQRRIQQDNKLKQEREARAVAEKEKKKQHEWELAQICQERHWKKLKAQAQASDSDSNNQEGGSTHQSSALTQAEVATTSQAGYEGWQEKRNGVLGGKVKPGAVQTNWFHPFLWVAIDNAMCQANWSCEEAVKILQRECPELYGKISHGVVWKWKAQEENDWSEKTKEHITNHHALLGSGRVGVLGKYPALVQNIKDTLQVKYLVPVSLIKTFILIGFMIFTEPSYNWTCSQCHTSMIYHARFD